jgi:SAM-dependent methyltransferase
MWSTGVYTEPILNQRGNKMTAHKTARARKTISAPMKYLSENGLLGGVMLDYGCGKGFDADHFGMYKFDPYYTDGEIVRGDGVIMGSDYATFDLITCNYVINVLEGDIAKRNVIENIYSMLRPGGKAYIAVRRDVTKPGVTKTGTYQENAVLDLPVLVEVKNKYCIYVLSKSI